MDFEKKLLLKLRSVNTYIKEKPYTFGFYLAVILVSIPLLTWILYFIGDCGFILINTSLSLDGALGFYGSFLAFLGTVALSTLALWQTQRYQAENKKLTERLFEVQVFAECAFFKTESCKVVFDEDTMQFGINIYLRNVGKSTAVCALPYELEFSKFGYKIGKSSNDVTVQFFDKAEANVLPDRILIISSTPIEYTLSDEEDYFSHITISIVSANQIQYDQEIQLHFKYSDGRLKYLNEYPSRFLKLYNK